MCVFALNSTANGCNVTLNSSSASELVSVFISKTDNTHASINYTTGIPDGDTVLVNVYDVVEGDSYSVPAVKDRVFTIEYPTVVSTTEGIMIILYYCAVLLMFIIATTTNTDSVQATNPVSSNSAITISEYHQQQI